VKHFRMYEVEESLLVLRNSEPLSLRTFLIGSPNSLALF
jgi:hypothetical protein